MIREPPFDPANFASVPRCDQHVAEPRRKGGTDKPSALAGGPRRCLHGATASPVPLEAPTGRKDTKVPGTGE